MTVDFLGTVIWKCNIHLQVNLRTVMVKLHLSLRKDLPAQVEKNNTTIYRSTKIAVNL